MKQYGESYRYYLVDIKSVSSPIPRRSFSETEIRSIAEKILDLGRLVTPLILMQTGMDDGKTTGRIGETYKVIEGYLEYYAAKEAYLKDTQYKLKGMIDAIVIIDKSIGIDSVLSQKYLLSKYRNIKKELPRFGSTKLPSVLTKDDIRFYLTDISDIEPTSDQFDKKDIDIMAESILDVGGLIKPLLLYRKTVTEYLLFDGTMEGSFALHAVREADKRNKDILKGMVSSYVFFEEIVAMKALDQNKIDDYISKISRVKDLIGISRIFNYLF